MAAVRGPPEAAGEERSLLALLAELEAHGYAGQFATRPGGRLLCFSCGRVTDAHAASLFAFRRLEGASDPADMVSVLALACPACGNRGTLVVNYGPEMTAEDAEVLAALADRRGASPERWTA